MGSDWRVAQQLYWQARELGVSKMRAESIAHVASRKDCWDFARNVAARVGCHRRTFQRAMAQARAFGWIEIFRGKKGERPKGKGGKPVGPFPCGFSHRLVVGRDMARSAYIAEVARARLRYQAGALARTMRFKEARTLAQQARRPEPRRPPPGMSTLEWIESELGERRDRDEARPPPRDGPDP
jgi:hypothetical protein